MAGRFRDARVGSRILAGVASGVAIGLLSRLIFLVQIRSGGHVLVFMALQLLSGVPHVVSFLLENVASAIAIGLGVFLLFLLLRAVFRRDWLAGVAFTLLLTALAMPLYTAWTTPLRLLLGVLFVVVMLRFGMAALVTASMVAGLLSNFPITTNFSAWYAGTGLFGLALVAGLAVYAFHTALAGRSVFSDRLFE